MKQKNKMIVAAVAAFTTLCCFAEWQEIGPDTPVANWPDSGDVRLSWVSGGYSLSVDTAEKAAKVAGWDRVQFPDYATYLAFSQPGSLTVKAQFSGEGYVVANAAGKLTFTGDNRDYVATKDWTFTDTDLHIGGEWALGAQGSHKVVMKYTTTAIADGLHLTIGWDGQAPDENGIVAYTNHVAIVWDTATLARIGSSSASECFVQDADMYIKNSGGATMTFYGRYEQISGLCGRQYVGTCAWALTISSGGCYGEGPVYSVSDSAVVKITGSAQLVNGDANRVNSFNTIYVIGAEIHIGTTGGVTAQYLRYDVGALIIEDEGQLKAMPDGTDEPVLAMNLMNTGNYKNKCDLNGRDAVLGGLTTISSFNESTATYYYLISEQPATLTLSGVPAGQTMRAPVEFRGSLSLVVDNACTNWLARRATTTTGDLTISNGVLGFQWGASWTGNALTINDGGVLDLESGTSISVKAAKIGESELAEGSYTVAQLKAAYPGLVIGDDMAVVSVTGMWQDFDGTGAWPTSGRIRINSVLSVDSDEKAAKVAGWDAICLNGSACLAFSDISSETTISAPIFGTGTITAYRAGKITLSGDNRGAAGVGDWIFEDTYLHIGHEYALGPKGCGRKVNINTTSVTEKSGLRLTIGWEGQLPNADGVREYTNHVALVFKAASATQCLGSSAADEKFVQDADCLTKTTAPCYFMFYGRYKQISGMFGRDHEKAWAAFFGNGGCYGEGPRYTTSADSAVVEFSGDTKLCVGPKNSTDCNGFTVYTPEVHLGHAGGTHSQTWGMDTGAMIFESENALSDFVIGCPEPDITGFLLNQSSYRSCFNLNGYDQRWGGISSRNAVTETTVNHLLVTSAAPATVTLVDPVSADDKVTAVEFSGAAGLTVDNGCNNVFAACISRTTGKLTVRSGKAILRWRAGWLGPVVVEGTGVLKIEATAANPFGTKAEVKSRCFKLTMKEQGKLELESGTTYVYEALRGDGSHIAHGTYTSANCNWVTGAGALRVLHDDGGCVMIIR